ncbi:MAG: hypothetical protein V4760_04285, partial [Bdellovibrionota bacterium]
MNSSRASTFVGFLKRTLFGVRFPVRVITLTLASFASSLAIAAPLDSKLSRAEFEALIVETAPKVDAFQAVWKADRDAKIFGGASRDFALFLASQFASVETRVEVESVLTRLRSMPRIRSRDFLRSDSDLDVLSAKDNLPRGADFAIGKVESINPARLDPATVQGRNEIDQGSLPTEKILIARTSVSTALGFGDGLGEIHTNRPTIQVPEMRAFWSTYYATQKLNHPLLLSTRYLRIVSNLQLAHEGPEVPFPAAKLDSESLRFVKEAIKDASNSSSFNDFLSQPKFREWLTKTLFSLYGRKSSLPATELLMRETELGTLIRDRKLLPINHLRFVGTPAVTADAHLRSIGIEPAQFFEEAKAIVPDLQLYHGTEKEAWFQLIVRDGFVPSSTGLIGPGLYSVARPEIAVTRDYTNFRDSLVVAFGLDPDARIADLR